MCDPYRTKLILGYYYRFTTMVRSNQPIIIRYDDQEIFRGVGNGQWQKIDKMLTATSDYFDLTADNPVEMPNPSLVQMSIFTKYNKNSKRMEVVKVEEKEVL